MDTIPVWAEDSEAGTATEVVVDMVGEAEVEGMVVKGVGGEGEVSYGSKWPGGSADVGR